MVVTSNTHGYNSALGNEAVTSKHRLDSMEFRSLTRLQKARRQQRPEFSTSFIGVQ